MQDNGVPVNTLRRLPLYLNYLHSLPGGAGHVSARQIAQAVGFNDVQVRKDLAAVSHHGRPKTGYETRVLTKDIEARLAGKNPLDFAIAGMGHLGTALAQHQGFAGFGLHFAAAFDIAPHLTGRTVGGITIHHADEIKTVCQKAKIPVGIITVPPVVAQTVCDALVQAGVQVIWNFAPVHLNAPDDVLIENANIVASLGILTRHLAQQI